MILLNDPTGNLYLSYINSLVSLTVAHKLMNKIKAKKRSGKERRGSIITYKKSRLSKNDIKN